MLSATCVLSVFLSLVAESTATEQVAISQQVQDANGWSSSMFRVAVSEAGLTFLMFLLTSGAISLWQHWSPKKTRKSSLKAKQMSFEEPAKPRREMPKTTKVAKVFDAAKPLAPRPRAAAIGQQVKSVDAGQVTAAIRAGNASDVPSMLETFVDRFAGKNQDLEQREVYATNLLLAALRACLSSQHYCEALMSYDVLADKIGSGNQSIWSILLYSSVQTTRYEHGKELFSRLCAHGQPSGHDIVNVVKCLASQEDASGLKHLLAKLRDRKCWMDNMTRNRSIASCTASRSMQLAEVLMSDDVYGEALDSVSYNTLMKGHIRTGKFEETFRLFEEMKARNLPPSEITFGILLDTCFCTKDYERAQDIFEDLKSSGLRVNAVHYTSLIKGLVAGSCLDKAQQVFNDMQKSPHTKPDLITFSTMLKAYMDNGDSDTALVVFGQMLSAGVEPDDIVLRSLFTGRRGIPTSPSDVLAMFDSMVEQGLKPKTWTFGAMVRVLVQVKAFPAAIDLLQEAPTRFGVYPDARTCKELAQACARNCPPDVAIRAQNLLGQVERRDRKVFS